MSNITSLNCVEKKYSYQHIQGMMLLNLNKVASQIKLSHSEYRVICTLIGLYNKNHNKAFPTLDYLAKICTMGKSTIVKALNRLVEVNLLIVVKTPGKRNNYYFSKLIFNNPGTPHVKPLKSTSCKTTHDNKQIKIKTNKNKTLSFQSNNDVLNTTNLKNYKTIIEKLESWKFCGAKKTIKKIGLKKIQDLINEVENKSPKNKGAYLRSLLNLLEVNPNDENKTLSSSLEGTQIEQMLKYQYWKHLPTGKIYAVKPKIGTHLLIRYHKNHNMIEFLENRLIDKLENFKPII